MKGIVKIVLFAVIALSFVPVKLFAESHYSRAENSGLKAAELTCIAIAPENYNFVFLGTNRGLFFQDTSQEGEWKKVEGYSFNHFSVNQIYIDKIAKKGYVASDEGLFELVFSPLKLKKIFYKSNREEKMCLTVCNVNNEYIFVGTGNGLFRCSIGSGKWVKVAGPFSEEEIVSCYSNGGMIYIASKTCCYSSDDAGRRWRQIYKDNENDGFFDEEQQEETIDEEIAKGIRCVMGSGENPEAIYLVSSSKVLKSGDKGKNWSNLSLTGLSASSLRQFFIDELSKKVLLMAKNVVYELKKDRWESLLYVYDCRDLALKKDGFILATAKDIYTYSFDDNQIKKQCIKLEKDSVNISFENEPTVSEVQMMAIKYAEVSNEKIQGWRRKAGAKAILPKISFGYNNNVYGTSSGSFAVGPNDWDVSVSWDLGDIVYNDAQTSIDVRSKLMVQLRNDILSEVTSLYFERRKLQIEIARGQNKSIQKNEEDEIRLMELTALIDRLTGGEFSGAIK